MPTQPSYRYTFISHAHADNALCDPIAQELALVGVPHYYDREAPKHGELLPFLLQEEIHKAQALVVLVTPNAQASEWVKLEIAMFLQLKMKDPTRKLVWVRLVECEVEPLLAAHLGIDAVGRSVGEVVAELAQAQAPAASAGERKDAPRYTLLATLVGHTSGVWDVAWSPDGTRLVTASWDHTARVWEATSGRLLATLVGHADKVNSVAWAPDGTRLATGSGYKSFFGSIGQDNTARVWEAASGRLLATLSGHTNAVRSVAWAQDGARLATASRDGTVRIWGEE